MVKLSKWAASWAGWWVATKLGVKQPKRRPRLDWNTRSRLVLRDWRCRYCGLAWSPTREFEADHVIPVARGGRNRHSWFRDNLVLACRECNQRKGAQLGWVPSPLPEWRAIWLDLFLMAVLFDWPTPEDIKVGRK